MSAADVAATIIAYASELIPVS